MCIQQTDGKVIKIVAWLVSHIPASLVCIPTKGKEKWLLLRRF